MASAVFGTVATLGLFLLMQSLVRPPRKPRSANRAVPVEWLAHVPAPPPAIEAPRPRPVSPPPRPVAIPAPRLSASPPRGATAPVAAASAGVRAPTGTARAVVWRGALDAYLRRSDRTARRYAPPPLPPRPASPAALPERMRLDSGGEIDRIGSHCYAVPSDIAYSDEAGGNPSVARVMHSLQPLFAHEVACDPGARKSAGEDFLEKLHKLAPAAPLSVDAPAERTSTAGGDRGKLSPPPRG